MSFCAPSPRSPMMPQKLTGCGLRAWERRIRIPYFHAKPLDEDQLRAWRAYLDWEEDNGEDVRVRHLYERCAVACCAYPEFRCRYASYLSPSSSDEAVAVLDRGLSFLKHALISSC